MHGNTCCFFYWLCNGSLLCCHGNALFWHSSSGYWRLIAHLPHVGSLTICARCWHQIYVFTWAAAKTPVFHGQTNLSPDLLIYHWPLIINLPRFGRAQELLKETTRCCFASPGYQPDVQQVTAWTSGRRARSILLIRLQNVNGGGDSKCDWMPGINSRLDLARRLPLGHLESAGSKHQLFHHRFVCTAKNFNSYVISTAGPQY